MARFDCATWRPISTNLGGTLSANLGLILHHQAGNGSLFGWFNNPSARVSATFWVGKDGRIEQYADSTRVTWHGIALNSRYCAVETEGCPGGRDEPMTEAMVASLARLYAEGARRHGWANQLASANGQRGFGFHRMAVATACPCNVRLNMRTEILRRAFGGGTISPPPIVVPPGNAPNLTVDFFGMRHNSRHPAVRTWQQRMRDRGWSILVDQIFGQQSDRVCRQFQAEKDLGIDGLVGPITWAAAWNLPVT